MSESLTTKLGLVKPTPGTGELVDVGQHLNANWDKLDADSGATICTSASRPVTPYNGQIIFETDSLDMFVWDTAGSAWRQISPDPDPTKTVKETITFQDDRAVLDVTVGTSRWYNRSGVTYLVEGIWIAAGTAPAGASLIVDVNLDGSSIFLSAGRPTIVAGANSSSGLALPAVNAMPDGSYLTFDIDQVGSSVPGGMLTGGVVISRAW